ncbi:MAG: envelope stress response membrane protein PspB [Stagnimonas sp.]|nr:envelope stress response membrane protein PspB [Stagnimonas sp.]
MEITVDKIPAVAEHAASVSVHGLPEGVEIMMGLMGASLVLFILFVLPIWLFLHYRAKARREAPAPILGPDIAELAQIARIAERMERRLEAMETLMDADRPGWRR